MLKRLFLIFFFSGSLDGFSQDKAEKLYMWPDGTYSVLNPGPPLKPDTLRAICLVTLFQNGIAHARMGYVVICEGKEAEYLDCRKKALKLPQVGWRYKLIDPNYKK
jgi:hypothetical protein